MRVSRGRFEVSLALGAVGRSSARSHSSEFGGVRSDISGTRTGTGPVPVTGTGTGTGPGTGPGPGKAEFGVRGGQLFYSPC